MYEETIIPDGDSFGIEQGKEEFLKRKIYPVLKGLEELKIISGFKKDIELNREIFGIGVDLIIFTSWGKKILCNVGRNYNIQTRKKCNEKGIYYFAVEPETRKSSIKKMLLSIILSEMKKRNKPHAP